ncbi:MAG: hypothetical protein M1522_03130 [Actinobacteria bacterium]|jgi:type II secretory pathway pseudopilin PulG|nr:hypothetical protein [Actinomycetota bacterium]
MIGHIPRRADLPARERVRVHCRGVAGNVERGATLLELMVAMLVFMIAITMSFIIVTNMDSATVSTLRQSHSAESVQVGMSDLSQYIRGAVTPLAAANAEGANVTPGAECWGNDLVPNPPPSNVASVSGQMAQLLAIVVAAPFDLVYCGYAPTTTAGAPETPNVYEITIAPGSCRNVNGAGYCMLAVYDCGASYVPGAYAFSSSTAPASTYLTPSSCVKSARIVWEVQNVWCDAGCRAGVAGTASGSTPAMFNYYTGGAGEYSATGASPSQLGVTGPPLGIASGDDVTGLMTIQLVVPRLTILANANAKLAASAGTAGTQVSQQVWLANQLHGGYQPQGESTVFSAVAGGSSQWSYWPLDDSSATAPRVTDASAGNNTGTIQGSVTEGVTPGPSLISPNIAAMKFSGSGYISTATKLSGASITTFTIAAWFKTSSDGALITFSGNQTESTTCAGNDRNLYVGTHGHLHFGVWPGYQSIASSPQTVNDGKWHLAVATLSSAGQDLYLDGNLVAHLANTQAQTSYSGWWRIGNMGDCGPWQYAATAEFPFTGNMADVAVYDSMAFSASQVQELYQAAGYQSSCYTSALLADSPSALWPMNDPSSASPNVADTSGNSNNATVQGSVSYGVNGGVPCDPATPAMAFSGGYLSTANSFPAPGPQPFSIAAWFKTTSNNGGIIQYSDQQTSPQPGNYDRQIYVDSNGHLDFGICDPTNCPFVLTSPQQVTDGNWHLVVATVSPQGSYLYLDGTLVASSTSYDVPQQFSTSYLNGGYGWWRIGELGNAGAWWTTTNGSSKYPGGTVLPFSGELADVAVWDTTALSGLQVEGLWLAANAP